MAEEEKVTGTTTETETPAQAAAKAKVDAWFDALLAQTARGLSGAERTLVVIAHWLEARAKAVGELATRLRTPAGPPAGPPSSEAPTA